MCNLVTNFFENSRVENQLNPILNAAHYAVSHAMRHPLQIITALFAAQTPFLAAFPTTDIKQKANEICFGTIASFSLVTDPANFPSVKKIIRAHHCHKESPLDPLFCNTFRKTTEFLQKSFTDGMRPAEILRDLAYPQCTGLSTPMHDVFSEWHEAFLSNQFSSNGDAIIMQMEEIRFPGQMKAIEEASDQPLSDTEKLRN